LKWTDSGSGRLPILSWCGDVEPGAMKQAVNLSNHPGLFHHVALMPDCHPGYGMPIGGVIASPDAVIPYAVGVDIGCGICATPTSLRVELLSTKKVGQVLGLLKRDVPVGEGNAHRQRQTWNEFERLPDWLDSHTRDLAWRNLGTLGGGNHFMEMQKSDDGSVWLMIHTGSRNLGYRIAEHHHRAAMITCGAELQRLPDRDLAWLSTASREGKRYIAEMNLALDYAAENRQRIMGRFRDAVITVFPAAIFGEEINIHHNYASLERHFGRDVWVHRKGATSAVLDEPGVIPGSMGTPSFIVRGLGNPDSFSSCSHGAGRRMGRKAASRILSENECDRSMEGIVFDGWRSRGKKRGFDLSEAPAAYKDIEVVMKSQADLVESVVRLRPVGVVKG
jgi:tRNA-splicing ligase RtcB